MPAILTPLAADQIAAFSAGDERAFESIARSRFEPLVEKARTHLGDQSGAAARVAMSVLLGAWTDRSQFTTPLGFDSYLDEMTSHRSNDELRRRASLHRFELHEGVHVSAPTAKPDMTADEAWEQISERLHVSAEQLAAHREEARTLSKQHAREHVNSVASRRLPLGMLLIGAVLLAAVVYGMQFMNRGSAELALTRALEAPDVRTLQAFPGQRGTVTLLDESSAQLGAGSKMLVPNGFGSSLRGVSLDGAAHFVVAPNKSPAFQVRSRGAAVIAEGTEFAVRAYDDDPELFVSVREGSVRVHPVAGKSESHTLQAGQAIAVAGDGSIRTLDANEAQLAFSWIDGELVLDDMPLNRALDNLRRWHNVDAHLADSTLAARRVSARLTLESAGEALDALSRAAGVVVTYDGTQMMLRDAADSANAAAPASNVRRP